MKQTFLRLLSLTLCAVTLGGLVPAMAAEPAGPVYSGPVRVWGTVSRLEGGSLHLTNPDPNDPYNDIIIHLSGETAVVDAVTGLPMDPAAIADGDTVYAWVGPAMTMSLPPQTTAVVVVANIPADFGAPQYYEVARADCIMTLSIPEERGVAVTTTSGEEFMVMEDADISPWRTRQLVSIQDLTPGARILVWRDDAGRVTKVVLFPYAYRGYLAVGSDGEVSVSGQVLPLAARSIRGQTYVPLRAAAETAGYDVAWDREKGAVVSSGGEMVLSVRPDTEVAVTPEGETGLTAPCLIDSGVTWLPAGDAAYFLKLFWCE